MKSQPAKTRSRPPVWLMGVSTLCPGLLSGGLVVTVPQLLAARGVPELDIASITGLSFLPGTFSFLLAPILDVGLSRRAYAVGLGVLMAVFSALAFNVLSNLPLLAVCMFTANISYYLFTPAVAGWFGQLVGRSEDAALGAWLAGASVAGFGAMASIGILLLRGLPFGVGVGAICTISLAPMLLFLLIPHEPSPTMKFRQSFGPLLRNLVRLAGDRHIIRMLVLFALPCATFALTNTLSGLGRDFRASEAFVGLIGGLGTTAGGIFGALIAPILARRVRPLTLYILIGVLGALFTLCLLAPARTPLLFAVAMIGENVFQAAAFAVINAAALLSIAKNSPIASTQFAVISAASIVPIAYMQYLDGKGYDLGGLGGSLLMDAGLSLLACLTMASVFKLFWSDTVRYESVEASQDS